MVDEILQHGLGVLGQVLNMRQGAAQFCRKSAFTELQGFDEQIFMGEDIDFYWRMTKFAKENGGRVEFIDEPKVTTSSRRFDKMGLLKTLVITHPFFIAFNWKRRSAWKDWYENAVR